LTDEAARTCVDESLQFAAAGGHVAEVLLEFTDAVTADDGRNYTARACGGPMPGGNWQGWLEFVPLGHGEPVRSGRETTQPNRVDTEYWATGLTYIYLEGALRRALQKPAPRMVPETPRPVFDGPAENPVSAAAVSESILDPFSVYRKGEALLRRQLSALAGWHLVNIIRRYELSPEGTDTLSAREPASLVELIIDAVRQPSSAPR
jgi:hypothetical protein